MSTRSILTYCISLHTNIKSLLLKGIQSPYRTANATIAVWRQLTKRIEQEKASAGRISYRCLVFDCTIPGSALGIPLVLWRRLGALRKEKKIFPPFSVLGVAGCYFVLKNPLADNPLWVKIWVGWFCRGFRKLSLNFLTPKVKKKS